MRVRLYILFIFLSGSLMLSGCHTASKSSVAETQSLTIRKSPNDKRQYEALVLPNKLQVILVSDPSLENSAASLAVGVGSAQDPMDQMGLAHYLEHMLFLGTEKYPEPDGFRKFTEANGGRTNASTHYSKTNYLFQINASRFDDALDRFSDYFKKPTFDPQFSDKERNAINNEWSMKKAMDGWNYYAIQGMTANPNSPSAKFTIGNLDTLKDKTGSILNERMKQFYNAYYSANIMKLTLVGKQSLPELKALAEKHFSSIPNRNIVPPTVTVPGLTTAEMGRSIHYKPFMDAKEIFIEFPLKSNHDQWRVKPNEYIYNLLTSEEVGSLCEQMRQKGMVKAISAKFDTERYGSDGHLMIYAELTELGLQKQDEVIAAIFAYIDLIKQKGLDERYFHELQAMRSKDFANALTPDPLQQAETLSMLQFDIPVPNLLDSDYIYEKYDVKAIKQVLNQLEEKRARIWYVNPGEVVDTPIPHFGGKYAIKSISAEDYQRWDSLKKHYSFDLPPFNDLFTDKTAPIVENLYLKPHLVVSQQGIEAYLAHPEFYREDKGQLLLQINVDFAKSSARQVVLAALLNEAFKKHNATLIDRALRASLGVHINLTGSNSQTIWVNGYTTKHELLMTKLLESFTTLSITDLAFFEAKDTVKSELVNQKKEFVARQLYLTLHRMTNLDAFPIDEQLAALEAVTREDLVNYHEVVKKNPLLRIYAFGNYTEEQIKRFATAFSGILPGARLPESRAITRYGTPRSGQTLNFSDSVDLADNALFQVWFGNAKSDDEQAQLIVLNSLFNQAIFMQLRTKEQLGYIVESLTFPVDDVPGIVMVVQSSNTDLPGIKSRMDKFRNDYFSTLKTTDAQDIERAKQALIANVLERPTDFYGEADRYIGEFLHAKYQFDGRDRYLASLKKVTKDDLLRIYEKLLLNDKAGKGLLQLRGTNFKDKPYAAH